MKVKDFIERLQVLDQDKDIWIVYDGGYTANPPKIEIEEEGFTEMIDRGNEVKKGDYTLR